MGWKVVFSPQSLADLAGTVRYIAKDNPEKAERTAMN
jgi:plasmid stabilization system protein ParE